MAVRTELLRERGIDEAAFIDSQSIIPSTSSQPTPPARSKKRAAAKRGNEVLSPPKLPAAQHVKIDDSLTGSSPRPPLPRKSPNKKTLVPPVTDLFACPANVGLLSQTASTLPDQQQQPSSTGLVPLADDLFACPPNVSQTQTPASQSDLTGDIQPDSDHSVYIGSKPI